MHKDLETAFNRLVSLLEKDPRCKGCWHYGSVGRGMDDDYSDYDPVFLVSGHDFESFSADVPKMIASVCDELLICWPEDYNSDHFRNYCNVIRLGESLHQHDFFIVNEDRAEEWWCRQHLKGCTRKNIIFDRSGEVSALLDRGLRTDNSIPDVRRAMDTYWFHAMMLVKYFKRRDIFKLVKNMDFVFNSHVNLLLSLYDTLDWGAWESKVKLCVPKEKQEHLLQYFTPADFHSIADAIRKGMEFFRLDAEEVCAEKGIVLSGNVAEQTILFVTDSISDL